MFKKLLILGVVLVSIGCNNQKEKINERNFWKGNIQFNPSAFSNRWSESLPKGFLAEIQYWTRLPNPRPDSWKPVLEGIFAKNEWSIYHYTELEKEIDEFGVVKWEPVEIIQGGWCWLVSFYLPNQQRTIFAVNELDAKEIAERMLVARSTGDDDWTSFFPNNKLPWKDVAYYGSEKKILVSRKIQERFPESKLLRRTYKNKSNFQVSDLFGSSDDRTAEWVITLDNPAKTIVSYGRGWIMGIVCPDEDTRNWFWYPPISPEAILKILN